MIFSDDHDAASNDWNSGLRFIFAFDLHPMLSQNDVIHAHILPIIDVEETSHHVSAPAAATPKDTHLCYLDERRF